MFILVRSQTGRGNGRMQESNFNLPASTGCVSTALTFLVGVVENLHPRGNFPERMRIFSGKFLTGMVTPG